MGSALTRFGRPVWSSDSPDPGKSHLMTRGEVGIPSSHPRLAWPSVLQVYLSRIPED
jgi:hypothetical protein